MEAPLLVKRPDWPLMQDRGWPSERLRLPPWPAVPTLHEGKHCKKHSWQIDSLHHTSRERVNLLTLESHSYQANSWPFKQCNPPIRPISAHCGSATLMRKTRGLARQLAVVAQTPSKRGRLLASTALDSHLCIALSYLYISHFTAVLPFTCLLPLCFRREPPPTSPSSSGACSSTSASSVECMSSLHLRYVVFSILPGFTHPSK
jgi:hypothetical protein